MTSEKNSRMRLLAVLCAALAVAGCVNQQKEMAIYRGELDRALPPATRPAGVGIDSDQTLTLGEAMALANRDNERLSIAGEDYLQALIDKDRAFATFLPTISLAPATLFQEDGMAGTHTFDLPVRLDLNVNGYSQASRLLSTRLRAETRRELMLDLQATLLLEVAYTYYGVLQAEKSVQVLEDSLNVQQLHVSDVTEKVKHGTVLRLDLEQSRAREAATRVQLTEARNRVSTGRATLALHVGLPYVRARLADELPVSAEEPNLEAMQAAARENRRDLLAARSNVKAARQDVQTALGQWFPSVNINLNAFLYRESFPTATDFTALIGVNLPLFTGGRIYADVRDAWSRHRQSCLRESYLTRQVAEQIERAWYDYQASRLKLEDLKTQVAAAKEAFRIASDRYAAGDATSLDRLDAQDQLKSAELRFETERYVLVASYLNLRRLAGLELLAPDAASPTPESAPAASR